MKRTAAAGIEARIMPGHPGHDLTGQDRIDRGRHLWHVAQIIVDRLGIAGSDIAHHFGHAAFGLAREQMNAEIQRFLEIDRQRRQHGDATAHMKAADDHRHAESAKLPPEIERARILIRLNADQADHAAAGGADAPRRGLDIDDGVALVASFDLDVHIGTENAIARALFDQAVGTRQTVRRQRRAQPLNDVAVVIVVRRLDQNDPEGAHGQSITPNALLSDDDGSSARRSIVRLSRAFYNSFPEFPHRLAGTKQGYCRHVPSRLWQ